MSQEAASMELPATIGGSSHGCLSLKPDEHKALVESVKPFHDSVVRIITVKKKQVVDSGTGFLVHRDEKRSLFLSCSHNFSKGRITGVSIRFSNGETYPVEKMLYFHADRDLSLFSVKNVPEHRCVEFSTDKVEKDDIVVLIGHIAPTLPGKKNRAMSMVLVKETAVLTGEILVDPFPLHDDKHYEKIQYTCEGTGGVSGGPLFKEGKVIGVHLAADKSWRDAISTKSVIHTLREWLKVEIDNVDTIEKLFEIACAKNFAIE